MNTEELNMNLKFNRCKFRSAEEEQRLIKRCSCQGGDYTVNGYACSLREIFQLTPEICEGCAAFEEK